MGSFERKLRERPRCGGMLVRWDWRWTLYHFRIAISAANLVDAVDVIRGDAPWVEGHGPRPARVSQLCVFRGHGPPGLPQGSRVTFLPYFRPSLWRVEALKHPAINRDTRVERHIR